MKNFKFIINGNKYEVNLLNMEDNIAEIEVNGSAFTVEIEKKVVSSKTPKLVRAVSVPTTESDKSQQKTNAPDYKGSGFVKSPLPGVILGIFVREGDIVKIGDKLLTLEAMKMENNINSDKSGVIKSIKVKQGDSVLEGDVLIEVGA